MMDRQERWGLWTRTRPVPLRGVVITAVVYGGHAAVVWRQRFCNEELAPIEAVYTMPLPAGAAMTRLSLEAGGRRIEGEVRPREEALQVYEEALAAGDGAALLEQERDEVATLSAGSILPGEEVTVEVEFLEPLQAQEGALRWRLPTRVAPRYIPGQSTGVRDGYGTSLSTRQVPDAGKVTPPEVPWAPYGFGLSMLVDLGVAVRVESPSHRIRVEEVGGEARRVSLAQAVEGMDRDLVIEVQPEARQAEAAVMLRTHREEGSPGYFALTLVPDLGGRSPEGPRRIALVLDVSGSMEGASLERAVEAARLCLRHLQPGDLFLLLAFSDEIQRMDGYGLRVFDEDSLRRADRWLRGLQAGGGTEMKAPLLEALQQVHEGVVVLLTDGQVANEDEILQAARATGSRARVYGFGVGTEVCEGLLRGLARASGGAVELIHPGEAIEARVLGQVARALASRVEDIEVLWDGVEVDGLSPALLPPLVEGQVWSLFGRYHTPGTGRLLLVGRRADAPFEVDVPLSFPARSEAPGIPRLWARERIRELEQAAPQEPDTRWQIIELATHHGLASRHTSLVVVERRDGERVAATMPRARVVEVQSRPDADTPFFRRFRGFERRDWHEDRYLWSPHHGVVTMDFMEMERERGITLTPPIPEAPPLEGTALLGRQDALGLWGTGDTVARLRASAEALATLADQGITSEHELHGALVRKGVLALLGLAEQTDDTALREQALGAAWKAAAGRRTRAAVLDAARRLGGETFVVAVRGEAG
ncbi:MAG: VWA domain-containing protein [Polyangiaceae bacterium]|nr:VWA domain-containing protein [Polyangiaceae bacterium]